MPLEKQRASACGFPTLPEQPASPKRRMPLRHVPIVYLVLSFHDDDVYVRMY
jgi:hypothetical protein